MHSDGTYRLLIQLCVGGDHDDDLIAPRLAIRTGLQQHLSNLMIRSTSHAPLCDESSAYEALVGAIALNDIRIVEYCVAEALDEVLPCACPV